MDLDKQISKFIEDGGKFDRYLYARHLPLEQKDVYTAKKKIESDILANMGVRRLSELGNNDMPIDLLIFM